MAKPLLTRIAKREGDQSGGDGGGRNGAAPVPEVNLRHQPAISLRPEPGKGERLPQVARYELIVVERHGVVIGRVEKVIEKRKERIAETAPKREQVMSGRGRKSQRGRCAECHETAHGPLPSRCNDGNEQQTGKENDRRIVQPHGDGEPKARPCPSGRTA